MSAPVIPVYFVLDYHLFTDAVLSSAVQRGIRDITLRLAQSPSVAEHVDISTVVAQPDATLDRLPTWQPARSNNPGFQLPPTELAGALNSVWGHMSQRIYQPKSFRNPLVFMLLSNDRMPSDDSTRRWRASANLIKKHAHNVLAFWVSQRAILDLEHRTRSAILAGVATNGKVLSPCSPQEIGMLFTMYLNLVQKTVQETTQSLTSVATSPLRGPGQPVAPQQAAPTDQSAKLPQAPAPADDTVAVPLAGHGMLDARSNSGAVPAPFVGVPGDVVPSMPSLVSGKEPAGAKPSSLPTSAHSSADVTEPSSLTSPLHEMLLPSVIQQNPDAPTTGEDGTRLEAPITNASLPIPDNRSEIADVASPRGADLEASAPAQPGSPTPAPSPSGSQAASLPTRPAERAVWSLKEPDDGTDPSPHFENKLLKGAGGWWMAGASRRGKMHEHEATYRDDSFEFGVANGWNLVAVGDGAGSARLSRLGSAAAVKAAVARMKEIVTETGTTDGTEVVRATSQEELVGIALTSLREATQAAVDAIKKLALDRNAPEKLFATTLLLLMHRPAEEGDIVGSLQVGDGYVAAETANGRVVMLGEPDSGESSGETYFLTSRPADAWMERAKAPRLTGTLRQLTVMTDGVGDDFFPPEETLPRLFRALTDTVAAPASVYQEELNRLAEKGPEKLRFRWPDEPGKHIRDWPPGAADPTETYKEALARALAAPVQNPGDVQPSYTNRDDYWMPRGQANEADALYLLIGYDKKGSFDDRTLAVLYRR